MKTSSDINALEGHATSLDAGSDRSVDHAHLGGRVLVTAELATLGPLMVLVKQAQHRQNRALEAALLPTGLSLVQWNAIVEIDRNPGASLHSLAECTFTSDQAFGMLAARLTRLGLVDRRSGLGRATIHELTRAGRASLEEGAALIARAATELFLNFDPEKRSRLERLLQELLGQQPI